MRENHTGSVHQQEKPTIVETNRDLRHFELEPRAIRLTSIKDERRTLDIQRRAREMRSCYESKVKPPSISSRMDLLSGAHKLS